MIDPNSLSAAVTANSLPAFISLSGSNLTIAPTDVSQVGSYDINLTLSDGQISNTSKMTVFVLANQAVASIVS